MTETIWRVCAMTIIGGATMLGACQSAPKDKVDAAAVKASQGYSEAWVKAAGADWPVDVQRVGGDDGQVVYIGTGKRELGRLQLKDGKPFSGPEFMQGAADYRIINMYDSGRLVSYGSFFRGFNGKWRPYYKQVH